VIVVILKKYIYVWDGILAHPDVDSKCSSQLYKVALTTMY